MLATIEPQVNINNSGNAIRTFLECEGNLALAVERAQTTRAQFLYELSQNPDAFKQAIHTMLLINLASTLPKIQQALLELINHLEPADAARTYAQVANIVAHVTAPQSNAPTLNQFNLNQFNLTPEIREALSILTSSGEGAN